MKPLTRDILLTLSVKFLLLIALWWVCFKDVEKSSKNTQQWLLGASLPSDTALIAKKKS
ncbi:cytochrome oxidase putative small subunit CydP [Legionella tunisiensis]|uniref:cytochrome oxidase putative small subunit CydP n=1 Tax=Legionella tunisiensis TaxID=1034944 RepID=UPI0002F8358F|nr:cytochrome oxidase putative small subunit CydP [Legionella tunisiensis]